MLVRSRAVSRFPDGSPWLVQSSFCLARRVASRIWGMSDKGYVDYFEILELDEQAKPGEVRKNCKRKMKDLIIEISRVEISEERRSCWHDA